MSWHNKKEFVCSECGRSFKKFRQYKQHMKDAHGMDVKKDK